MNAAESMWANVCGHVCVNMGVRLYECSCVHVCKCLWTCMYVSMCVRLWMQLCACVQMFVHIWVSVCVRLHECIFWCDRYRSVCACLCVCVYAHTWLLIMKSKQRKVSSDLWQERDPQPSHPDENIPFLFWRTSVGRDHFEPQRRKLYVQPPPAEQPGLLKEIMKFL